MLGPAELGIEPRTLGLKDERARLKEDFPVRSIFAPIILYDITLLPLKTRPRVLNPVPRYKVLVNLYQVQQALFFQACQGLPSTPYCGSNRRAAIRCRDLCVTLMVKLHFLINIQTHTSKQASINFLGPAEPGIEPRALALNDERARTKEEFPSGL